jgi:hypothetical protein
MEGNERTVAATGGRGVVGAAVRGVEWRNRVSCAATRGPFVPELRGLWDSLLIMYVLLFVHKK